MLSLSPAWLQSERKRGVTDGEPLPVDRAYRDAKLVRVPLGQLRDVIGHL